MERKNQRRSSRKSGNHALGLLALVLLILIILTGGLYILHRLDIAPTKPTPAPTEAPTQAPRKPKSDSSEAMKPLYMPAMMLSASEFFRIFLKVRSVETIIR